jgi:hypothetical protein
MGSAASKAKYFILASLALGFLDGVTARWLFPRQPFAPSSFVFSIVGLFVIFLWYRLDSDSREFQRTPLLSVAIVGVAFVAVPYYLFRTRGFRQGLLGTLVVLLAAVGYSALGYVGQLAARAMRT